LFVVSFNARVRFTKKIRVLVTMAIAIIGSYHHHHMRNVYDTKKSPRAIFCGDPKTKEIAQTIYFCCLSYTKHSFFLSFARNINFTCYLLHKGLNIALGCLTTNTKFMCNLCVTRKKCAIAHPYVTFMCMNYDVDITVLEST
jgi:hypothetical protein